MFSATKLRAKEYRPTRTISRPKVELRRSHCSVVYKVGPSSIIVPVYRPSCVGYRPTSVRRLSYRPTCDKSRTFQLTKTNENFN